MTLHPADRVVSAQGLKTEDLTPMPIEKLDPKAKRQITQLLDTFIEREKLKQRVNAQEA